MEPMTLGSPNNSPASSPYLPPFLTGTPGNALSSPFGSPTGARTVSSPTMDFNNSISMGGGQKIFLNLTAQQQQQQQQNTSFQGGPGANSIRNLNASVTGPPTQGLFDSLREERNLAETPKRIDLHQTSKYNQSFNESYLNQSRISSPIPVNEASIRNAQYIDSVDSASCLLPRYADFWITIFGFPQNATSMILSHFSQCGAIIEKIFPPQSGNWVHIRYSSKLECDKALSYNEKILNNNIMIGVTRCKDPAIVGKENINDNQYFKIRPLTQVAYNNKQCETAVTACHPAPQKSSGIMNKAMDLLFGW